MNGNDLKTFRVSQQVKAGDLARHLGVSNGRLSQIEALAAVQPAWVNRYHIGLSELVTKRAMAGQGLLGAKS